MTRYITINYPQGFLLNFIMKVAQLSLPEFKTESIFTVILQRVKAKSTGKSSGKGSG